MFRFPVRRMEQFALLLAVLLILGAVASSLMFQTAGASPAQQSETPTPPPPDPAPPLPPVPPAPDNLAPPQCAQVNEIPSLDCATLVDIYNKMGGATWFNTRDNFEPWFASNTPCAAEGGWYGVDCGLVDGVMRVTSLSLTGEYTIYGGKLGNNLTGAIPGSIGNLDGLAFLNLSFNQLAGPLPPEIGYLIRLNTLGLVTCVLPGPFPAEIGHLTELTHLDLHAVRFTGPLPNQLGWLEKLTYLHLGGGGRLTGGLPPQLGRLTNLTFLQIYDEPNLGGPDHHVPDELANLSQLTHLGLANLGLTGDFPGWTLELSELKSLYLNGNLFSGPYPTSLGGSGLTELGLSPIIAGDSSVPTWIADMESLEVLGLTGYSGQFPAFVAEMNLRSLGLESTSFTGSVPAALWNNPNLATLTIVDDTLALALPAPEDVDLPVLHGLRLGGGHFTGDAAVIGQLTALRGLTIQGTAITGDLSWLMNLPLLEWTFLNDNNFSGPLPTGWAAMTSLRGLEVGGNQLSGPLPADLADAPALTRFVADRNAFAGMVPDTFTKAEMPGATVIVSYNALWTENPAVVELLEAGQLTWAATQTRPPTEVTVSEAFPNGVTLTWTLPAYVQDLGYYIVDATADIPANTEPFHSGCPTRVTTTTSVLEGKETNTAQVTGLCPGTTYDYAMRTVTLPHGNQPNRLESAAEEGPPAATQINALSVVIVAGDSITMTQKIDALLSTVHSGMNADPGQFTVVLVDAAGKDNTAIYLMAGQEALLVPGLPRFDRDEGVVLDPNLREYDMGNSGVLNADPQAAAEGNELGAFLRWAITKYAPDNTTPVTVSFVGHGIPLAPPVTRLECVYDPDGCQTRASLPGTPWVTIALPSKQDENPGWTDETSKTYITPYTLAAALDMGTNGGERRIQVLDVVHCFAATVEEFYEVATSPTMGRPMVDVILGSPNYNYFGPELVLRSLLAADLTADPPLEADVVGAAMLAAYDTALAEADTFDGDPDADHPRLLIMVDNRAGQLQVVKQATDELAAALYAGLDAQATHAATRLGIHDAHMAAVHYDTTYCRPQDWQLDAGDGLADFYELTHHLQIIFAADNAVLNATEGLESALFSAVVEEATVRVGGQPWFATTTPAPTWTFDTPGDDIDALGLAIYADFVGTWNPGDERDYVGMAGYWYTSEPFYSGEGYAPFHNPRPLRFIRPAGGSLLTWADVLRVYWQGPADAPRPAPFDRVPARACGVELPLVRPQQWRLPLLVGE